MPKIGNIGLDAVLSDGDKLLGTDSGGQTKNFILSLFLSTYVTMPIA